VIEASLHAETLTAAAEAEIELVVIEGVTVSIVGTPEAPPEPEALPATEHPGFPTEIPDDPASNEPYTPPPDLLAYLETEAPIVAIPQTITLSEPHTSNTPPNSDLTTPPTSHSGRVAHHYEQEILGEAA
jgi:hypothetical protein